MPVYKICQADRKMNLACSGASQELWDAQSFNLNGHNYLLGDYLGHNCIDVYVFDVELEPRYFISGQTYPNYKAKFDNDFNMILKMWLKNDMGLPLWQFLYGIFEC